MVDGPNSLIAFQVESGLVVRMAILYELLAGRERPQGATPREGEGAGLAPIGEPA